MKPPLYSLIQLVRGAAGRLERRWFGFKAVMERRARQRDFYFVQIGANDGITVDPIREYVLRYGWKGVLVEPQKKYFQQLQQNYAGRAGLHFENVAIGEREETKQLFVVRDDVEFPEWRGLIATFKPQVHFAEDDARLTTEDVRCVTLASLVAKHALPHIDLLQIDTEGYDYEILQSVDFTAVRPRIIHYEHKHLTFHEQFTLKVRLKSHGYLVTEDGTDTVAQLFQ
jgi:FkbM family methyltransferase